VYFYDLANTVGVDHIAGFLGPLGFGSLTGIDISGEKPGLLPSREWKKKAFSRPADQMWFPGETVNFGIGQGYFLVTPLQLAHYASILANRGASYKPRLVNGVRDPGTGQITRLTPQKGAEIRNVTPQQWQIVMEGMVGTTKYGTAAYTAGKGAAYTIAGKTGTAQVFTVGQNEKLDNQKTVSERLRDHSWFIAFAPAEAPRIAVAVIVENGGFGSAAAAPIVRKIMDTYLLDANGQLKVPLPAGAHWVSPQSVTPPGGSAPSTEPEED
jgi:penicillin-binding protein 2